MRLDTASLRQMAAERKFDAVTLEKVLRLLDILKEIARHPYLNSRLVLKGGTALNLFWWNCPRLSVDIDLNYIGALPLEEMEVERPQVIRALETIARAQQYQVQFGKPAHASTAMYLRYHSALGSEDNIGLDINFLMRCCLFEPIQSVCRFNTDSPVSFPVVSIEEVMAGKLVALLDRAAPRDLYDTYQFVRSAASHDEHRLRQVFILFAAAGLNHPIEKYDLSRMGSITEERISRELWPVLTQRDRPAREAMIAEITPLLSRLLDLQPEEKAFVDSVFSGEPDPTLLFPENTSLVELSASHPALLWKVKNIREYLKTAKTRPGEE